MKEATANGATVTSLTAAEREAFVKATRPVYAKWKPVIGADLVNAAEKAVAGK
jgi:TRAP-type C4-dicarboxylate transport system substrate-binding protein